MEEYQYIIIGGGMTGSAAIQGIREVDPNGSIAILSAEMDPPYNRPPLTKGLWKGKPLEKIFRRMDYQAVHLFLENRIVEVNPLKKQVVNDQGTAYQYEKLLLATGGTPRRLPFDNASIIYYRTLEDYRLLRSKVERRNDFVVIGGGFIGSEITAALSQQGKHVTMIFPEEGIGWRVFPPDLSAFVTEYYRQHGVDVLAGDEVVGAAQKGDRFAVATKEHGEIVGDSIIAGIGIKPNVELAEAAGIAVNDGILVDEYLQTNQQDIYSAGDAASFYTPSLDTRRRVEHEENANVMGKLAGRNMAGMKESYTFLPMFYSDMFDLGYEAVGITDPRTQVIEDWVEPNRKGAIYYLIEERVKGVLLWNIRNKVNAARTIIEEQQKTDPLRLRGLLTG